MLPVALQAAPIVRLPIVYAEIILLLFVAMIAVHWARRAFREPIKGEDVPNVEGQIKVFDVVQRLYHWSLFITAGLMTITGVALYVPGTFNFLMAPFGVTDTASLLTVHLDMVWALLGLIVIHSIYDVVRARGFYNIWVGKKDFSDTLGRTKNFFGMSNKYPKNGKFDIFMKTLHWGMVLSLVVLGISGLYFWNPYGLMPAVSPGWDTLMRELHDIFGFLFIGLVVGHVYFSILPTNWPILRAIFTGKMDRKDYLKEYDTDRWPLERRAKAKAPKQPVKQEAPTPITRQVDVTTPPVDTTTRTIGGEKN